MISRFEADGFPSRLALFACSLAALVGGCASDADVRPIGTVSAPPGSSGAAGSSGLGGGSSASGRGGSGSPAGASGTGGGSAGGSPAGASGAGGGGAGGVGGGPGGTTGSSGAAGMVGTPCDGVPVDDDNPCTLDSCDPATGLIYHNQVLDDADPCTDDICDLVLGIVHKRISLGDGDPCTIDTCSPTTGPVHTPSPGCVPCLSDDVCDDDNPCTVDICDPKTSCRSEAALDGLNVSDGNACNGVEVCKGGAVQKGMPPSVDDQNACTVDSCDPKTGEIKHVSKPGCMSP